MAHQTLIAEWLYKNKDKFQVQFNEMNWPKKYNIPYFDFQVTGLFMNKKIVGRGVDIVRSIALEKACAELIENVVCLENKVDSIGVSNSGYAQAEDHARNESLERYFLNQHLRKEIHFKLESTDLSAEALDVVGKLSLEVNFYKFNTDTKNFGYLCKINSPQNNTQSFGFSLSRDKKKSIEKSFSEALPNYLFVAENSDSKEPLPWQVTSDFRNQVEPLLQLDLNSDFIHEPKLIKSELDTPVYLKISDFPYRIIKIKTSAEDVQ